MRSTESDNLLIVEAHAVEDVTEVLSGLRGVGEAAAWWALSLGTVDVRSEREMKLRRR